MLFGQMSGLCVNTFDLPSKIQTYKTWNGDAYDSQMLAVGYKAPLWAVDYLLHLNLDKNIKILDVCCGTGLVARYAKEKGYHNVDALDASAVSPSLSVFSCGHATL